MPSHTFHVVQAFEDRDGGIVPVGTESLPICRLRPCVGCPACAEPTSVSSPGHELAILNSATGIPPGAEYGISQQVENEGGLAQLLIRFRQAVCLLGQDFDEPTGRLKMKKDSPPGEDRRAIQAIRIG
jgi:hypothetical protein